MVAPIRTDEMVMLGVVRKESPGETAGASHVSEDKGTARCFVAISIYIVKYSIDF